MTNDFVPFVQAFANRRRLKKKAVLQFRTDGDRPRIYCEEPVVVARFSSELRQKATNDLGQLTRVLLRGQTKNYPGMVPGLFRSPSAGVEATALLSAEVAFERSVRKAIPIGRFMRPKLAALLQHYGYRTSWLDVVDNLWTAVWFATHAVSSTGGRVKSACASGSGWLYFVAVPTDCSAIDLRDSHHGLSLRPHAQAGWSIRGNDASIGDLNPFVIATVEFPISERWKLTDHMASDAFFFPSSE